MIKGNSKALQSKSRFLYLFLGILIGITIAMVLSEIALRILVKLKVFGTNSRYASILTDITKDSICRISKDPVLGFEFIPGSHRSNIRINSDGFRGPEYSYRTSPDTIRVAILGDSESVGLLLEEGDTISACLSKELNKTAHGKKFEILDFGFPGYNIQQKARILEEKALRYHPSIVILHYVFNDPLPYSDTVLIKQTPLLKSYLYVFLRYHSEFTQPSFFQYLHRTKGFVPIFQKIHYSEDFERCKELIIQMGEFLHKKNIRFMVVISPELICYDDFKNYPYKNIHKRLLELSSSGIEVIDPLKDLASVGLKPADFWVTQYDCHKSKIANRIIAKSISDSILSDAKK